MITQPLRTVERSKRDKTASNLSDWLTSFNNIITAKPCEAVKCFLDNNYKQDQRTLWSLSASKALRIIKQKKPTVLGNNAKQQSLATALSNSSKQKC